MSTPRETNCYIWRCFTADTYTYSLRSKTYVWCKCMNFITITRVTRYDKAISKIFSIGHCHINVNLMHGSFERSQNGCRTLWIINYVFKHCWFDWLLVNLYAQLYFCIQRFDYLIGMKTCNFNTRMKVQCSKVTTRVINSSTARSSVATRVFLVWSLLYKSHTHQV